jgi:hypothetical protein
MKSFVRFNNNETNIYLVSGAYPGNFYGGGSKIFILFSLTQYQQITINILQ